MTIPFIQIEQTGQRHLARGVACQDKTHISHRNRVAAISLADGAGFCRHAGIAATVAQNRLHPLLAQNYERYVSGYAGFARCFLAREVRCILTGLADEIQCDYGELGSTLLYAGVREGDILVVHLGDGWVCGVKGHKLTPLSLPQNGKYAHQTYLTTSASLERFLTVQTFSSKLFEGLFLCSDGFPFDALARRWREPRHPHTMQNIGPMAKALLLETPPQDDCSFISLALH